MHTFSDIDECSLPEKPCAHTCVNVESSYICLCHKGYYLDDDGHTCLGGYTDPNRGSSFGADLLHL